MTHNEKRAHWIKEALLSTGAGVLYGLTSVAVGHPLDTIKTKMQAQKGFEKISMSKSFMEVLRTQGVRGLYRGCIPPLMGSGIYRYRYTVTKKTTLRDNFYTSERSVLLRSPYL